MNEVKCDCGHRRSGNMKEICGNCHKREYWFKLYLFPEEAMGLKVAAIILISAILLVVGGLTAMYLILGSQLVFLPQIVVNLVAL